MQDDSLTSGLGGNRRGGVAVWKNNVEAFVELLVGGPNPQRVRAQIDTGSSMSVIPSVDCLTEPNEARRCAGYIDIKPYDRQRSDVARIDSGNVSIVFADGSILWGVMATDACRLATFDDVNAPAAVDHNLVAPTNVSQASAAPRLKFVYVLQANDVAREGMAEVGAILGLGPAAFDSDSSSSSGVVGLLGGRRVFSLALGLTPPRFFAGYPPRSLIGGNRDVFYTRMRQASSARLSSVYVVELNGITFGHTRTALDSIARGGGLGGGALSDGSDPSLPSLGDVVLDSGTTLLLLPGPVYARFWSQLTTMVVAGGFPAAAVASRFPLSELGEGHLSKEEFNRVRPLLPPLMVMFDGFYVVVPPTNLFTTAPCSNIAPPSTSGICYGLAVAATDSLMTVAASSSTDAPPATTTAAAPVTLLGDPFMASAVVVFDNDQQRVGFTPAVPGRPISRGIDVPRSPVLGLPPVLGSAVGAPATSAGTLFSPTTSQPLGNEGLPTSAQDVAEASARENNFLVLCVILMVLVGLLGWLRYRRASSVGRIA